MNGFTYTLTLQEPVLANSLSGDPNSANSLFYVPGGLVRGAAINAYNGIKDAGEEDFRRLFLDGRTRFLNAYPLSGNGRALPTPLQYKKPKYFSGSDFSSLTTDTIQAIEETWQVNVHTQRDAEAGHATEKEGAVYRYIALPAGLILEGAVLAEDKIDTKEFQELFQELQDSLNEKTILLGKARTAGYGKVWIETTALKLNESGELPTKKVDDFTLTLLSPAIVRDENGQPALDISTALTTRLGVEVKVTETCQRAEVVGGFNRTWGLPLPQVTAIAAGSFFQIKADVEAKQLADLQETGIGERRAEGFGRVAVNLSPLPIIEKDEQWLKPVSAKIDVPAKSDKALAPNPTAKLMVTRLARKELEEKIIHAAREMTSEYQKGKITNSQLSRWRVVVRTALDKKDIKDLLKFIEESKGKTGWKKMEKAKIKINGQEHPQRLTEWMEEWLKKSAMLQDVLKPQLDRFMLGENSFKMEDTLNLEYRLRLLDAVLAVMAKKNGGSND